MRRHVAVLALILSVVSPAFAQEGGRKPPPPLDPAKVRVTMERAVDDFIRPGYSQFRDESTALDGTLKALCTAPTPERLAATKEAFAQTVAGWSRIEIVRIGPVLEQNRFERILYYPDRKGLGLRQVQRALSQKDESVLTGEGLTSKSVAIQGLGALEYVLYGSDSETLVGHEGAFRCRYGMAIAANVANMATELAQSWNDADGIAKDWKHPGPDNPVFRNEREAMVALLGILVHASEAIRDQRIETFYKGPDKARFPRSAIYWRSGLTWTSIGGNLTGVRDLLKVSAMDALLPPDQRSITGAITFIATSMARVASGIDRNIEHALADEDERNKVDYLLLNGKDLIYRLSEEFGGAIDLSSGFSFADGD